MDKTLKINMKVKESKTSVDMSIKEPFYIISKGGQNDYQKLINKPSIEDVTLIGNKTFDELGSV